jgi:hypothetical protein
MNVGGDEDTVANARNITRMSAGCSSSVDKLCNRRDPAELKARCDQAGVAVRKPP